MRRDTFISEEAKSIMSTDLRNNLLVTQETTLFNIVSSIVVSSILSISQSYVDSLG